MFPNCPVCGDSIRQLGEVCDKGAGADGSCCNSDCTAFTCATPTVTATPTSTRTATPVPTPTRTATATIAIATVTATPTAQVATATRTSTPGVATATVTPGPGATATTTATRTSTPVVTTTATSTPAATATSTSTPTVTATSGATATAAGATATRTATPVATTTPVATSTAVATTTPVSTVTATTTPIATVTATTTPNATSTAVATATSTPVVTATATTTFAATATATVTPAVTTTATASPTFAATATPTVTPTRTATPTASSTATRSPTPTASATFNGTGTPQPATPSPTPNANPLTAKAANKCQNGIKRAGAVYTAKRLKSLDKCANGVLKCVQEKPGDSKCLDSATIACSGEMIGKRGSLEADFRDALASKCEDEGLTVADLLDPDTLGFDGIASECAAILGSSVASIGDIADCVLAQHECTAERIFGAEEPRAGELLTLVRNRGASFDAPPCLADFGAAGAVDAPLNKAVDKCEGQIKSAGSKFAIAKLRSLERCIDALLSCDVVKPGDSSCLAKASSTCSRELAKIETEAAKMGPSIDKRCSADSLAFGVLAGTDGANLDALTPTCADLGVSPLDSLAAYETCLFRQHSCEAEELLRFEAPRSEELLSQLSPPVPLHSNFCPATP